MKTADSTMIKTINGLVNLPREEAVASALKIIGEMKFKKIEKQNRLKQDVQAARNSSEICRIMYYTVLAGEGLSTVGSEWQKHFK